MNYYDVLGVEPTATPQEIKTAYRKLAIKHHPDQGGDSDLFKQLTEAYDTLKDPHKRAAFDHATTRNTWSVFDDLDQFNVNIKRSGSARQKRNKDLSIDLELTLEETLTDTSKTVSIKHTNGQRKFVNVTVPRGTINGNLRYQGLGDTLYSDQPPGNLLVKTHVRPHADFELQGIDVKTTVTISVWEAILGTSVRMKTLSGKTVQITVKPGTQHGTVFNVPGHGIPKFKTNAMGRMLVMVAIKIPQNLTTDQLNTIRTMIEDN